jgi:hypothetical protein
MVNQGIFRAPYALQRGLYGGGGGAQDPLAALIGGALGTYQSETERSKADALAQQREQDQMNWRNFSGRIEAAKAGFTTQPSAPPPNMPTGFTPSDASGIRAPSVVTAQQAAGPELVDPTGVPLYRGLSPTEQKATEADVRTRTIHQRVGHMLLQHMGVETPGSPVSDEAAEGVGAAPGAFVGLNRQENPPPRNIDPLSPEGQRARIAIAQATAGLKSKASTAALTGSESRAAASRLLDAAMTGKQLEDADIGNAIPSTAAAGIGGVIGKIAGERAGTGVTTALRGSKTNNYQQAGGRWVDAYMSLQPKGRGGVAQLRDLVQRTYWGQEGDSPESVRAKAVARQAATAALARAVATGVPPIGLPGFEAETPPAVPEQ